MKSHKMSLKKKTDFTALCIKTLYQVFPCGSCKEIFIAFFLVGYSLIWLISQKHNILFPLAPLLVTGTVQLNGQIPQSVCCSSAEFPDTQKKADASEAQVSSCLLNVICEQVLQVCFPSPTVFPLKMPMRRICSWERWLPLLMLCTLQTVCVLCRTRSLQWEVKAQDPLLLFFRTSSNEFM